MKTAKSTKALRDEKSLRQVVARNVKSERKARGLSVAKVAEFCGLHPRHVQKIEYGELNITIGTLASLSVGLAMTEADLMREGEPEDEGAPARRAGQAKRKIRKIQ